MGTYWHHTYGERHPYAWRANADKKVKAVHLLLQQTAINASSDDTTKQVALS